MRFMVESVRLMLRLLCNVVKQAGLLVKQLILLAIRLYQFTVSPLIGPACRFYPSCSEYALESVKKYGTLKGSSLAVKRILKCHPFHPGGFDPVP